MTTKKFEKKPSSTITGTVKNKFLIGASMGTTILSLRSS
jgi:hypothetical protein